MSPYSKISITKLFLKLVLGAALYLGFISQPQATDNKYWIGESSVYQAINIELPEPVELAMILALISGLDSDGKIIKIDIEYAGVARAYFQPFSEHPIFKALGRDFNLPRLAGNAADFRYDYKGKLIEEDTSGSIWGDTKGDLFRTHLALIQDFSNKSKFREFYRSNLTAYQIGIKRIKANTDTVAMTSWLHRNFTARPTSMQIIVSPLIGGLNWTTLYKPQTRMFVPVPGNSNNQPLNLFDRVLNEYSIFTELDHSYVNVVTKKWVLKINKGLVHQSKWVSPNSSAASYSTAELQFNEYTTWAVYLLYAFDQLSVQEYEELEEIIVNFMQNQRGFILFKEFADEALRLHVKERLRAEDSIKYLVEWAVEFEAE